MDFPKNDSLRKLQAYVWQMNIERGFDEDASKKMLVFIEEVGELAKAIRKSVGLKFTKTTSTANPEEEFADVQIMLLGLASQQGVDMFDAVTQKEQKNRQRRWS